MTIQSDAEIFGEVGGENYFLPLSVRRNETVLATNWIFREPTDAQKEYAETFLRVPRAGEMLFTQYETMEYLWLGERAA